MMYKFTKKISCDNPQKCSSDIMNKLETKFKFKIHGKNPEGHISIYHENSNHLIWIFLYSQTGINDSENMITKQIVKVKSDKVIKFKGKFPTLDQIKQTI